MPDQISPEFASLQLALVDRFDHLNLGAYSDGVHQLTNFQRRLGLGTPTDPPSNSIWVDLLDTIEATSSHRDRVNAVMDAYGSFTGVVPEHIVNGWPTVGAFSIQVSGTVARTHFHAIEEDGTGPLSPGKLDTRREELRSVLAEVRNDRPELEWVAGASWLYTTPSYSSLFPTAHVANAVVRRDRRTFRGMSHWGQFLNHRWQLRTDRAEEFRHRVHAWTGADPCALFPIATLEVSSPVSLFDEAW